MNADKDCMFLQLVDIDVAYVHSFLCHETKLNVGGKVNKKLHRRNFCNICTCGMQFEVHFFLCMRVDACDVDFRFNRNSARLA